MDKNDFKQVISLVKKYGGLDLLKNNFEAIKTTEPFLKNMAELYKENTMNTIETIFNGYYDFKQQGGELSPQQLHAILGILGTAQGGTSGATSQTQEKKSETPKAESKAKSPYLSAESTELLTSLAGVGLKYLQTKGVVEKKDEKKPQAKQQQIPQFVGMPGVQPSKNVYLAYERACQMCDKYREWLKRVEASKK